MEDLVITIDSKEFIINFDKNDNSIVFVDGKPFVVDLMKTYGNNIFSFTVNSRLVQIELELTNKENTYITVDGISFAIDITNETKKLLRQFINNSSSGADHTKSILKAPMPGLVVKIPVNKDEQVSKGDKLIIIEAMKMENAILSPINGIVKSIYVKESEPVAKDTLLMEIVAPEAV